MANISFKRIQINKANTAMVISTAIAAFVVTFSVIAGRALLNKRSYQNKVIGAKETAVNQLQANIKATDSLATSYKAFVGTASNVLGGNPTGAGDKDGDNAKIILDALPSQYDFPALTSSMEKLLDDNGYKAAGISGTDDELAQQKNQSAAAPKPVAIPFGISVTTDLAGGKKLLSLLEHSIRPINIKSIQVSGSNNKLNIAITAETYYQPGKSLNIETKVVN
jgi:hypothetical protein